MKCARAQELFSSYLEKTIQPPMGVAFEQHLAECSECKFAYDRFHATALVLDELPEVEPPKDMRAAVMARVEQARRQAPGRVNWLHIDWGSIFTMRAPAKAFAMGAVLMLVVVMLAQFTPLQSITANLILGQRATKSLPNNQGIVPGPLPYGFKTDSGTKYADVGEGLFVGIKAVSSNSSGIAYTVRLGTRSEAQIPVQIYMLPEGAELNDVQVGNLGSPRYDGVVTKGHEAGNTIRIAQSRIAMVVWKSNGQSLSELVFLPSAFGHVAGHPSISVSNARVCDLLSKLSSDYGVVILSPSDICSRTATVNVDATSSASSAMSAVAGQASLDLHMLGSSVYEVK